MTKIADVFDVTTTRPLNALNVVGIAELAQFTPFISFGKYPLIDADEKLREEWKFELDTEHELMQLTFTSNRLIFKDGSTLTMKVRK